MDPSGRFDDLDRPPLDAAVLAGALVREGGLWKQVEVRPVTASTNDDVSAAARAGAAEGLVVIADAQTAGRGRMDRAFTTPPGSAAIVSVLLRPPAHVPVQRWVWLSLLAGLAVDSTVQECGVEAGPVGVGLKWPNDVLVGDRKISGILLERVETPAGAAAVVGIGINLTTTAADLPVPTATSLLLEGAARTDRTVVLRILLRTLEALYLAWVRTGGDPSAGIRDSYRRRCRTVGSSVRVELPDGSVHRGVASDVDEHGRIVVDGLALSAGDVTHVRPDDA
ncbi:biotin--[acetyl-CoA-carboxylase] ligase [Aeromicrobium sp. CF4.19]|uniref:biotin--[acetyl-CoA-carboxylase] ligase n=1 Tax=Aeromicrobium sp. CF4.19 TaxID=3373082 RepID=UPI003EE61151